MMLHQHQHQHQHQHNNDDDAVNDDQYDNHNDL